MTVLKARFHTHTDDGPTELSLTWYKHIPGIHDAPPGYVVSKHTPDYDTVLFEHPNHDTALSFITRTYRRMERAANEKIMKEFKRT